MEVSEEESYDLDVEIEKALMREDTQRAEALLTEKERWCKSLKAELKKEQSKEEEVKKCKLKEMQMKFKQLQKTEEALNKSIASSRASTPSTSPKARGKKSPEGVKRSKATKKTDRRGGTRKRTASQGMVPGRSSSSAEGNKENNQKNSEYHEFLYSLIDFKNGKSSKFMDLINRAMEATNYVFKDSNVMQDILGLKGGILPNASVSQFKLDNRGVKNVDSPVGCEQLVSLLNDFHTSKVNKGDRNNDATTNSEVCDGYRTVNAIEGGDCSEDNREAEVNGEASEHGSKKGKKLISGKCTKQDESDIQLVVKFAHEKLDAKHVQDQVFDQLPCNLLVVGEIEITLLHPKPERTQRLQIAKTICYHKLYLKDEDLRNGCDCVMKRVE